MTAGTHLAGAALTASLLRGFGVEIGPRPSTPPFVPTALRRERACCRPGGLGRAPADP